MILSPGCSTTTVTPEAAPIPPAYTSVPHPQGQALADVTALFSKEGAPDPKEIVKTCDSAFRKLDVLSQSANERVEGRVELVKNDPVTYHWCFYGKALDLEGSLQTLNFVDEKQKKVIETFDFMVPLARSFSTAYHDARYLHWATVQYRRLSEWLFQRRLDLTPAGTADLVQPVNPFGLWRNTEGSFSILEKYQLLKP